jgi:cytochrome P450
VISTDGDIWRRHQAITLPPFTGTKVAVRVWDETRRQTDSFAAAWSREGLRRSLFGLTLTTISLVGFGKQQSEGDDDNETGGDDSKDSALVPPGHTLSLLGACNALVDYMPHIMILPRWLLSAMVPRAHEARVEMDKYMAELLAREKARLGRLTDDDTERASDTLLTALLRSNREKANDDDEKRQGDSRAASAVLTDVEVTGNIFGFFVAGYETIGNTMLYCCSILALYPDIQDKVIAEIDGVWEQALQEGRTELSLVHDMPRFRYLLALMACLRISLPPFLLSHLLTWTSTRCCVFSPSSYNLPVLPCSPRKSMLQAAGKRTSFRPGPLSS